MASSRYTTDNKATYDSEIEVVQRDESNPHSTPFANDDYDSMPKAGALDDEPDSTYHQRSHSMTARRISESEDDPNQGAEQHGADVRTPLVHDVTRKKSWKNGWSQIHDMGGYNRVVVRREIPTFFF
jgi:hypothetical protein